MTPTRIAHIDTAASPDAVDGVASNLWLLCSEQARRGLDVALFSRTATTSAIRVAADDAGFMIVDTPHSPQGVNPRAVSRALASFRPDLAHFHGSWQPHHGVAGFQLRHAGIPYVYAPYGGLAPVVIGSRRALRRIYVAALEGPLARGASGMAPCFETELLDISGVLRSGWRGPSRVLSPPVPPAILDTEPPAVERDSHTVLYLGRYDIFQKGLDRLVDIAALTPEITYQLHGSAAPEDVAAFNFLRSRATRNVIFGEPVFGDDKHKALAGAGAYIQLSRFEGFPTSVAEALCSGLPAIVSEDLGIAAEIEAGDVGLVLHTDIRRAADRLTAYLADPADVAAAGARAGRFGRDTFSVASVVDRQIELYSEVLGADLSFVT